MEGTFQNLQNVKKIIIKKLLFLFCTIIKPRLLNILLYVDKKQIQYILSNFLAPTFTTIPISLNECKNNALRVLVAQGKS